MTALVVCLTYFDCFAEKFLERQCYLTQLLGILKENRLLELSRIFSIGFVLSLVIFYSVRDTRANKAAAKSLLNKFPCFDCAEIVTLNGQ